MANTYIIRATCTGIITERWRLVSERPLTREEAEDAVLSASVPDGATLDCTDEETSDEENRRIDEVECDEGEFAPDDDEEVTRG